MNNIALMKIMQSFEDFNDVARYQLLIELAESFEGMRERSIFSIPKPSKCIRVRMKWRRKHLLQDDIQCIIVTRHTLIFDDPGMRQAL